MTDALTLLARAETGLKTAQAALNELRAILAAQAAKPAPAPVSRLLTPQDYQDAADTLGIPLATVQAVAEVESGKLGGFGPDGRPIILFEPHVFSRETGGKFDKTHGGVSYPKWGTKPYPPSQAARWDQLEYAAKLPGGRDAALRSASYGLFQIMGFNHKVCGFPTVQGFFDAMHVSEREHLMAFVRFIQGNNLARFLKAGDWEAFARGYNGPGQAQAYGAKIAAAVKRRGG